MENLEMNKTNEPVALAAAVGVLIASVGVLVTAATGFESSVDNAIQLVANAVAGVITVLIARGQVTPS